MGFVAGAIALAGAASAGASIHASNKRSKEAKAAREQNQKNQDAAIAALKNDQAQAGTSAAQTARSRAFAASRTVYTSPLGIGGQAQTIKKRLLGE
jgi:hypothetical protein